MTSEPERPIEHPTYRDHIQHYFEPRDISCMADPEHDIDLATYEGVRINAQRIHEWVSSGRMPPQRDRKWSEARIETFENWMRNGYPEGGSADKLIPLPIPTKPRVRKDLATYAADSEELSLLKKAFSGLIERDKHDDPTSYFALAGLHWLPLPGVYCRHHDNAYNPWHRAYLLAFENALRTVEGCEDVTLPYWNILSKTVPPVLYEPPFKEYVIPKALKSLDGSTDYPANMTTRRNPADTIVDLVRSPEARIGESINTALGAPRWEAFNGWSGGIQLHEGIIRAHDVGHGVCGPTIANQDVAAFDPMFWFFHANWDRLWWRWQQLREAMSLRAFRNRIDGDKEWLDEPALSRLKPFDVVASQMIDLREWNVDYEHPEDEVVPEESRPLFGRGIAAAGFSLPTVDEVSVRVKGINRLEIAGSFDVLLMVDDRVIRRTTVFQSTTPKECDTCRKQAVFSADFLVSRNEIANGVIRAAIKRRLPLGDLEDFPMTKCGNPTINIRYLMDTQLPTA